MGNSLFPGEDFLQPKRSPFDSGFEQKPLFGKNQFVRCCHGNDPQTCFRCSRLKEDTTFLPQDPFKPKGPLDPKTCPHGQDKDFCQKCNPVIKVDLRKCIHENNPVTCQLCPKGTFQRQCVHGITGFCIKCSSPPYRY